MTDHYFKFPIFFDIGIISTALTEGYDRVIFGVHQSQKMSFTNMLSVKVRFAYINCRKCCWPEVHFEAFLKVN